MIFIFYNDVEIYLSFIKVKFDGNGGDFIEGKHSRIEQTTFFWLHRLRVDKEVKIALQYKLSTGLVFVALYDVEVNNEYCVKIIIQPRLKSTMAMDVSWGWKNILNFFSSDNLGKIGNSRLVVDKFKPKNLISFCGDNVKMISPPQFKM